MSTSDGGVKLPQSFDSWKIVEALWVLLVGFLAWAGQKAVKRLDTLELEVVRKADFDKALENIRTERLRMHEENKEIMARIEAKIDVAAQATMLEKIRTLEDRLERSVTYSENLKHSYVDPYIGEVAKLRVIVDRLERDLGS